MAGYSLGNHIVDPRILNNEDEFNRLAAQQDPVSSPLSSRPSSSRLSPSLLAPSPHLQSPPSLNTRRSSVGVSTVSAAIVGPPTTSITSVYTLSASSQSNPHHNTQDNLYSDLATYTFGDPRSSPRSNLLSYTGTESPEGISPLTPIMSNDHTPRPSVAVHASSFPPFSSHPPQGSGVPASSNVPSSSQPTSPHREQISAHRPRAAETHGQDSEDPDQRTGHQVSSPRGRIVSDAASQHTFGRTARDGDDVGSSSASIASSRSSSRSSFRSSRFELTDDEVDGFVDNPPSPVIFARDDPSLADIDEYDMGSSRPLIILEGRRGSLPMAIPGAIVGDSASVRSGRDSLLTLRRPSRSLDDDVGSAHLLINTNGDPDAVTPKSEPLSRGDWRTLEIQAMNQQQQQHLQQGESSNVYDGMNLQYILSPHSDNGSAGSRRSSSTLSYVQSRRKSHHTNLFASMSLSNGRRASTATFASSNEDPFITMVRGVDEHFGKWLFRKETAGVVAATGDRTRRSMVPGVQEIWRNEYVGRFKVDRLSVSHTDKPPQQRMNVRHMRDPYSKGNVRGGPSGVIHKHSRAMAFSIFRSYDLFTPSGRTKGTHVTTSGGIMLAPKKVQEQYTSTKTTSKLNTHGFLENPSTSRSDRATRPTTQSTSYRERERHAKEEEAKAKALAKAEKKAKKKKKKEKEKGGQRRATESAESSTPATSQGSSVGSVNIKTEPLVSVTASTSATTSSHSLSTTMTLGDPRFVASGPVSPIENLQESLDKGFAHANHPYPRLGHRDSINLDDPPVTRTPHAEAFATLDPNDVSHFHSKPSGRSNTDSGGPFALFKVLWRSSSSSRNADHAPGPPPASIDHAYSPPWLTTTPTPVQEGNARLMQGLNESFKDVGLLHNSKSKPSSKPKHKTSHSRSVFEPIPDDSLYMLLPLWPKDTDMKTTSQKPGTPLTPPAMDERQYLLVYYVPFGASKKGKDAEPSSSKKKNKSHSTSDGNVDLSDSKHVILTNFRVSARLVVYDDLRGTGVRVPGEGLSVTGTISEAMAYLPSPSLRTEHPDEIVISHSASREKGFLFESDGLTKLGLTIPPPASENLTPTLPPPEGNEEYVEVLLTPLGRAVVEMVWLGCLALTSFGPT